MNLVRDISLDRTDLAQNPSLVLTYFERRFGTPVFAVNHRCPHNQNKQYT